MKKNYKYEIFVFFLLTAIVLSVFLGTAYLVFITLLGQIK